MSDSLVSASRVIHADPATIFAVLSDASRHATFDGSGMVQRHRGDPTPLTLGSKFGMDMKLGPMPYRIDNKVVEFEPDRLIAWKHMAPHRWRYELEPVAGGTLVTESFDWSGYPAVGRKVIEVAGYPKRNLAAIEASLQRLADLVESET